MADEYKYFIVPNADVTEALVAQSEESSIDTLRHSVQGTDRVVMKTDGSQPTPPGFQGYDEYSHAAILELMTTVDWKSQDPYP